MIKGNTRGPNDEIEPEYYKEEFYQHDLDMFEGVPHQYPPPGFVSVMDAQMPASYSRCLHASELSK